MDIQTTYAAPLIVLKTLLHATLRLSLVFAQAQLLLPLLEQGQLLDNQESWLSNRLPTGKELNQESKSQSMVSPRGWH